MVHKKIYPDNRPSDLEYALMSSHVYHAQKESINNSWLELLEKGWKILSESPADCSSGYFGRIYLKESSKQIVVAHRGTNNIKSFLEDFYGIVLNKQGIGQRKDAWCLIEEAFKFLMQNDEYHHLSFTGHSLGGFLAEMSILFSYIKLGQLNLTDASEKKVSFHAVTFESPGCLSAWEKMQVNIKSNEIKWKNADIINFMSFPNAINTFDKPIGTVYFIAPEVNTDEGKKQRAFWNPKSLIKLQISKVYTVKCHSMHNIVNWFRKFHNSSSQSEVCPRWMLDCPNGFQYKIFKNSLNEQYGDFEKTEGGNIIWSEEEVEGVLRDSRKLFDKVFTSHFSPMKHSYKNTLPLRHFNFQEHLLDFVKFESRHRSTKMNEYAGELEIRVVDGTSQRFAHLKTKDIRQFRTDFSEWLNEIGDDEADARKKIMDVESPLSPSSLYLENELSVGVKLLDGNKWWPQKKHLIASHYERKKGDDLLIERLRISLTSNENKTAVGRQKIAISGLGGIGKTTTAIWFAHHYELEYDHIVWFDCGEESLPQSFKELAIDLRVANWKELKLSTLAKKCFDKLSICKCLCIFDNVEGYSGNKGIKDVLPECCNGRIHSIITSRWNEFGLKAEHGQIECFRLGNFHIDDSVHFFRMHLSNNQSVSLSQLKKLCGLLGNLPLALQIAVSYLNTFPTSLEEYIKDIEDTDAYGVRNEEFGEYQKSIDKAMMISISKIRGEDINGMLAHSILSSFAYIQPDNVDIEFLQKIEQKSRIEIERAVALLEKYSLVQILTKPKGAYEKHAQVRLTIHRFVQQVIRHHQERDGEQEQLKKILSCEGYIPYKLIPYIYAEKHDDLKKIFFHIKSQLIDQVEMRDLLNDGKFKEAVDLANIIYQNLKAEKGDKNKIDISLYNYVVCLEKHGDAEEALYQLELLYPHVRRLTFEKIIKWSTCKTNSNLEIDFSVIDFDDRLNIQKIEVQKCQLQLKTNDENALVQFIRIGQLVTLYGSGFCFLDALCFLAVSILRRDDTAISKVMHAVDNAYCTAQVVSCELDAETWIHFATTICKSEWLQLEEMVTLYEVAYKFMTLTKWEEAIEKIETSGDTLLNTYKKHKHELWKSVNILGNICKRIYGLTDEIGVTTPIGSGIKVSKFTTEYHWADSGFCLDHQFSWLIGTNHLTKVILRGYNKYYPPKIFRRDLIYSLEGCVHLNTLIADNVHLVGGGSEKVHLPNLTHFQWDKVFIATKSQKKVSKTFHRNPYLEEAEKYKFFYKENQCLLKDVITMQHFSLGTLIQIQTQLDSNSLEINGCVVGEGISFCHFQTVVLRNCKLIGTTYCECNHCMKAVGELNKKIGYENLQQLAIIQSKVDTTGSKGSNNFRVGGFKSLTHFTLKNEEKEDMTVNLEFLRRIKNALLINVSVNCVEKDESALNINEEWKLSNVDFVDSDGIIIKHVK